MSINSNAETIPLAHKTPSARARLGGIGHTQIYALIRDGFLRPLKIGASTMLLESELQRFVADAAAGDYVGPINKFLLELSPEDALTCVANGETELLTRLARCDAKDVEGKQQIIRGLAQKNHERRVLQARIAKHA